ncbi:MAG: hypothetical protein MJ003_00850 [Paludibacteraceae bacterium]|nr:hypothetical protein [Paludibacteraceae bacterium]
MKKPLKISVITLVSLVGLALVLIIAVVCTIQIALKPEQGNKLLDKYLPQFVNVEAQYDSINLDIVKSWPYVNLNIDGLLIKTLAFGDPDTLLYVSSLGAKANAGGFITSGDIAVPYLRLNGVYVKAQKKDSVYSWDVVAPSDEPEDTTALSLPRIIADTLQIEPVRLVFRDMDSHFMADAKGLGINAYSTEILPEHIKTFLEMGIDSTVYADTTINRICNVNNFKLTLNAFRNDTITNLFLFNAKSDDICLRDSTFNIERTSLDVYASAYADSAFKKYKIDTVGVKIDETSLYVKGVVAPEFSDTLAVGFENLLVSLDCPSLWRLKSFVPSKYSKTVDKLVFDGAVNVNAKANGLYKGSKLPVVEADINVSKLNGGFKKYSQRITCIDLKANGRYNQNVKDSTFVNIDKFFVDAEKNSVNLSGYACYKGGKEYVDLSLLSKLNLKVINEFYKFDPKQKMAGTLDIDVSGNCFIDDILKKNLYKLFTKTVITGDNIGVLIPSQKLGVYVDSLRFTLNTNTSNAYGGIQKRTFTAADTARLKSMSKMFEGRLSNKAKVARVGMNDTVLLNSRLSFSSLNVWYQKRIKAKSERFSISLSADDIEPKKVPMLRASVNFGGLDITADDSLKFTGKRMMASVNMGKNASRPNVPAVSLRVSLDSILACSPGACAVLDRTSMNVSISPRMRLGIRRGMTASQRDSAIATSKEKIMDLPALLMLADTLSKSEDAMDLYLKRFSNGATLTSKRLKLMDADFPLRTSVSNLDLEMNDDTIRLNNVKPRIGRSSVTLNGTVTNFRNYLLRNRMLKANFSLHSKRIDLNQLMRAMNEYDKRQQEKGLGAGEEMEKNVQMAVDSNDSEIEASSDSVDIQGIVVIPKNIDFRFNAEIDTLKFSKMNLSDFKGFVTIRNSRLRIKELSTSTEVGKAKMNVMYACAVPDSANAMVALSMDSVQVGDIVTYMPELDSIMPMLRSFSGSVEADASAQVTLDPNFNIVLPSVNAALRLRGDSLVLLDGETFTQIAKLLMFNKKTQNRIDSVSVEVIVKNNEVQIYPFMVGMDKYRLGVGGTQNLDMSFNYHIVVLKPTILSAIGLDVYGKDYDNIKFKLTSPKFKGFDVSIGSGGNLIKTSNVDIRQLMYDTMLDAILKEE